MSEENVEAVKRAIEAANRRDIEAVLEEANPEVEWPHPGFHVALGGEATVYRGHAGVRKVLQDLYELFDEVEILVSEIRDLGDRIVVVGALQGRGVESGADVTTPWGAVFAFKDARRSKWTTTSIPRKPSKPPDCGSKAMSEENVEMARAALDAWNRGDWDEWLSYLSPDIEFRSSALGEWRGVYSGSDQIEGAMQRFMDRGSPCVSRSTS